MNNDFIIANGELYSCNDLQHHGIKGMKWGVRRFQNPDGSLTAAGRRRYDVGEARQTMKDAKADMRSAKKEYDRAYNKAYNYSSRHYVSQFTNKKRIKESDKRWGDAYVKANEYNDTVKKYKTAKKEYKAVKRQSNDGGLTEGQKKAIKIGAAVAATALVAYGTYKLGAVGKVAKLAKVGLTKTDDVARVDIPKVDIPRIDIPRANIPTVGGKMSNIEKQMLRVNPFYTTVNQGSFMNCGNCTIALEARLRGLPYAAKQNPNGMTWSSFLSNFKGLSEKSFTNLDDIIDPKNVKASIENGIANAYDDGARGAIVLNHNNGAHFFNWTKEGGKVKFYDAQNPKADLDALFKDYKRAIFNSKTTASGVGVETKAVRLDNLEFNDDILHETIIDTRSAEQFKDSWYPTFVENGRNFVMKYFDHDLDDYMPTIDDDLWDDILDYIRNTRR